MDAEDTSDRPWEKLGELVEQGAQPQAVEDYLDALTTGERARAVSRLSEEEQAQLLVTLEPQHAADLLEELPEVQAADLMEHISPDSAALIIHELASDEQVDLLGDLSDETAEAILGAMEPLEAAQARRLSEYEDDVAGGLMITEFLSFPASTTVQQVVSDLRANAELYRDYQVQYVYVTGGRSRLTGVLPLRELLLASPDAPVRKLMISKPLHVPDDEPLEALEEFFDRHRFLAVPVLDPAGRIVGVLRKESVERATRDRFDDEYRKSAGLVKEELRSMPLFLRSRRRLAWLSVNILLNVVAASVIALYQDTLAAVIALAVFLPIISDMSGCSGNQAVAVSMRELALGLVRPHEVFYVFTKEALLGLINGLALGVLIASVAWLWKGNLAFSLVVGSALALNTLVAVIIGGTIPLILKRMGKDPALASGPILTTVTDLCGFFIVLSFASALLSHLTDM